MYRLKKSHKFQMCRLFPMSYQKAKISVLIMIPEVIPIQGVLLVPEVSPPDWI
jgi:hypothetical protein